MKSDLIYLKQRELMENKFGKVDHSCQLLEKYKWQILEFSFLKYLSIYLSIDHFSTYQQEIAWTGIYGLAKNFVWFFL